MSFLCVGEVTTEKVVVVIMSCEVKNSTEKDWLRLSSQDQYVVPCSLHVAGRLSLSECAAFKIWTLLRLLK